MHMDFFSEPEGSSTFLPSSDELPEIGPHLVKSHRIESKAVLQISTKRWGRDHLHQVAVSARKTPAKSTVHISLPSYHAVVDVLAAEPIGGK